MELRTVLLDLMKMIEIGHSEDQGVNGRGGTK
jgi:hypothetical protein